MSNTAAEFSRFVQAAGKIKAASVILVDGAQIGRSAQEWATPDMSRRPKAISPWKVLDERLKDAGVTSKQVQAVWIKQAEVFPSKLGDFPKHAGTLKTNLVKIVNQIKDRYPNARLAYLSSRIYGGYAQNNINPEPFAYEGAFAVRWVIQEQIKGEAALNWDLQRGPVKAPLLLWGPYLWANGDAPRKSDRLTWTRGDFRDDGTHPSQSGAAKVTELLLKFMQTDPTANTWFVK
jgi:hypothetical protein